MFDACLLSLQEHANNLAQCADATSLQSCLEGLMSAKNFTAGRGANMLISAFCMHCALRALNEFCSPVECMLYALRLPQCRLHAEVAKTLLCA